MSAFALERVIAAMAGPDARPRPDQARAVEPWLRAATEYWLCKPRSGRRRRILAREIASGDASTRDASGAYEAENSPVAVDRDTAVATGTSRYRELPGGPVVPCSPWGNPRIHIHFTPDLSSWLNLVEIWFAIIEGQVIRRGTFASVRELMIKIRTLVNGWNDRCHASIRTPCHGSSTAR
jgi:hypothetical protein